MQVKSYIGLTAISVALCTFSCSIKKRDDVQPVQSVSKSVKVEIVVNNHLTKMMPEDTIRVNLRLLKRSLDGSSETVALDTTFASLEKDFVTPMRMSRDMVYDPRTEGLYVFKSFYLSYDNFTYTEYRSINSAVPVYEEELKIYTIGRR